MPSRLEPGLFLVVVLGARLALRGAGLRAVRILAMLLLFVPYAKERLAMPAPTALMVLSVVQALSYLGGLPGGWLADRKLGARASTVLGALLLALSYVLLALDQPSLFWPALSLLVLGHSVFRPGCMCSSHATGTDEQAPGAWFPLALSGRESRLCGGCAVW